MPAVENYDSVLSPFNLSILWCIHDAKYLDSSQGGTLSLDLNNIYSWLSSRIMMTTPNGVLIKSVASSYDADTNASRGWSEEITLVLVPSAFLQLVGRRRHYRQGILCYPIDGSDVASESIHIIWVVFFMITQTKLCIFGNRYLA